MAQQPREIPEAFRVLQSQHDAVVRQGPVVAFSVERGRRGRAGVGFDRRRLAARQRRRCDDDEGDRRSVAVPAAERSGSIEGERFTLEMRAVAGGSHQQRPVAAVIRDEEAPAAVHDLAMAAGREVVDHDDIVVP
jgi:hypothetical protein